jgi:hypothetical protein
MSVPPEIEGLQLGALLGSGSWADVYEAVRLASGERVAVKVLRPRMEPDESSASRMLQEAQLCWRLDHPNVVRVHDWGVHPGQQIYLVMERLHGETVEQRIARGGPLTPATVLAVARGAALGLKAIHQRAVHRDIKPSNLFLCSEFADHRALKVLDLGIAFLPKDDPDRIVHTEQGEVVGTPAYAPPERFRGAAADERCDLYSLGAVLFECLTGRPAFTGSPMQIAVQACRATQPPPLARADVPEALVALVSRMLNPDPVERPASAEEVITALDALEERVDIERWAHVHRTGNAHAAPPEGETESFLAAVLSTVLQHFHPDHVPEEIRAALETIRALSDALEKAQAERDAAQAEATRLGRDLNARSEELAARLRSANTAVTAQRTLLERPTAALRQARAEIDAIDALYTERCAAFDALAQAELARATSLAEPVETGGRLGRIIEERLAELDGLAARRAHLCRTEQKTRETLERLRGDLGGRLAEVGQLGRALSAVEFEMASTLFLRDAEARDLAERAERLHLDRQHARLSISLHLQRELFV